MTLLEIWNTMPTVGKIILAVLVIPWIIELYFLPFKLNYLIHSKVKKQNEVLEEINRNVIFDREQHEETNKMIALVMRSMLKYEKIAKKNKEVTNNNGN